MHKKYTYNPLIIHTYTYMIIYKNYIKVFLVLILILSINIPPLGAYTIFKSYL